MGVLRNSGRTAVATAQWAGERGQNFIVKELKETKKRVAGFVDQIPDWPCSIGRNAATTIVETIEKILQLQPIAWSKQKLYSLYSVLMQQMERLIGALSGYVTPAMQTGYDLLKKSFERIGLFVAYTFEKLDDSLVTPVVETTYNGVVKTYTFTTDFAKARYFWVKDTLVVPVTTRVSDYVVMPIYRKVSSTTFCVANSAIHAGAFIDKKLSLVGLMQMLAEKSMKVDDCVTKGRITNGVVFPALEVAKSIDSKVTGGSGQELVKYAVDEFQSAKGERPSYGGRVTAGNVTSAGAPVYRK